jgi:hypothetical protein
VSLAWFIATGLIGIVLFSLLDLFSKQALWLRSLIALLATTALVLLLNWAVTPTTLGPFAIDLDETPFKELILFALMLCGMVCRVLSLAIEKRRAAAGEPIPLRVDKWEFVHPLLFAVPTFGALLSQVSDDALRLTSLVLAFQTGFFWQTILKGEFQDRKAPSP